MTPILCSIFVLKGGATAPSLLAMTFVNADRRYQRQRKVVADEQQGPSFCKDLLATMCRR